MNEGRKMKQNGWWRYFRIRNSGRRTTTTNEQEQIATIPHYTNNNNNWSPAFMRNVFSIQFQFHQTGGITAPIEPLDHYIVVVAEGRAFIRRSSRQQPTTTTREERKQRQFSMGRRQKKWKSPLGMGLLAQRIDSFGGVWILKSLYRVSDFQ